MRIAALPSPSVQPPPIRSLLTGDALYRQPVNGSARRLLLEQHVPEHDAAGNPPLSARIDYLA